MKKISAALMMIMLFTIVTSINVFAVDTNFCWPVETGNFSTNTESGVKHDIAVAKNTKIYAACDGTVTLYQRYRTDTNKLISYGNYVVLTAAADGGQSIKIIYAHLNSFDKASLVIPSENTEQKSVSQVSKWADRKIAQYQVKKGELLGMSGSTGNSTGPHLHFELYLDGARKEPTQFLSVRPSAVNSQPVQQSAPQTNLSAIGIFTKDQVETIYDKFFSPITYANFFPDLKNAYGDGKSNESAIKLWNHFHAFCLSGKEPTRMMGFSPVFQPDYYLSKNGDVAKAYNGEMVWWKALQHFAVFGAKEARDSHPNFSVSSYKARYADLRSAYGNSMDLYYRHYVRHGLGEGRNPK